jgi:replication-associated recombination protein RarA
MCCAGWCASPVEDIGLADPQALVQCLAAKDAYDFLGSPEGELAIVQACLYLRHRAQIERLALSRRRRQLGNPPGIPAR